MKTWYINFFFLLTELPILALQEAILVPNFTYLIFAANSFYGEG